MAVKFSDFNVSSLGENGYIAGYDAVSNVNIRISKSSLDATYQETLVSGDNIKTINGSSVLGSGDLTISGGIELVGKSGQGTTNGTTTITKSASILAPSNTLSIGDTLNIKATFGHLSGMPGLIFETYIYFNTADTLTGATLLGKAQGTNTGWVGMERNFVYDNFFGPNSLIGAYPYFFNSDISSQAYVNGFSFNNAVNYYIIFATKLSSGVPGADARLNQAVITKI